MSQQTTETSQEIQIKVTDRELNLWRLANSKTASDEEVGKAVRLLFQSLRQRRARYIVRQLGLDQTRTGWNW
jgi:hypothetical protein